MLVLLMGGINELHRLYCYRCHYIRMYTKFHEDCYFVNLKGCSVGIINGNNLWRSPLR